MEFDIYALTPAGGGHVLTVQQESKDASTRLVVIAGDSHLSGPAEEMMEQMLGQPLDVDHRR